MVKHFIGDDGLPVNDVGSWAETKLKLLTNYVQASSATRKKYQHNSPAYIDVFCGAGRSKVRETDIYIDGSPVAAYRQSILSGVPFSELHISDLDQELSAAAETRLRKLEAPVHAYVGEAEANLRRIVGKINPYGLHFAFLDPFNLESLSFSLFRTLSKLRHIDILVHVSAFDMQLNIRSYGAAEQRQLDSFAPGWKEAVGAKPNQFMSRATLIEYWAQQIKLLGFKKNIV